ncbi:MAG: putative molybdenum carrier protein [Blastocatellia bacterium]
MNFIQKIVSGGQTGADRAALDFAVQNGIEIGGFVPKGRMAEDGIISENYLNLIETESCDPKERTELNVVYSDATLILYQESLSGGSLFTFECAKKHSKPHMSLDLSQMSLEKRLESTAEWLLKTDCKTLNIAGPRASENETIYETTIDFLNQLSRTME